jgi:hypothetical protein
MKQRYRIQHSNRSMCWLVSGRLSERTPVFLTPHFMATPLLRGLREERSLLCIRKSTSRRFRVESQSSEAMTLRMSFLCFILMSAAFPENTGRYCLLRVPQSRVPQMSGGGVCKRRSSILSISCRGFSAASRYRIRPAPRGKRAALHTALYSFRSHILLWILRADTQKTNA